MRSGMNPIGSRGTATFSLTPELLTRLDERVAEGQLTPPVSIVRHGWSGGLVRFASASEALIAKMAIV